MNFDQYIFKYNIVLKKRISNLIIKKISIKNIIFTITSVKINEDLKKAKIYFTLNQGANKYLFLNEIKKHNFIKELNKNKMSLKKLIFIQDKNYEQSLKINNIIEQLNGK